LCSVYCQMYIACVVLLK